MPGKFEGEFHRAFLALASMALQFNASEAGMILRRIGGFAEKEDAEFAKRLASLMNKADSVPVIRKMPLRRTSTLPPPTDTDSGNRLLKIEMNPVVDYPPILSKPCKFQIEQIIGEWKSATELEKHNLFPVRTALFVGPPGVGKTLSAQWIAASLGLPLFTLHLSNVMSSYLGKTGDNIKAVLEYSQANPCVLLFDEFDAIGKKRDDAHELGELKRLVTVLLQEIDYWSGKSLMICATNHPELLDPAIWRRFEETVAFPLPSSEAIQEAVQQLLGAENSERVRLTGQLLSGCDDMTLADVERILKSAKKRSVLTGQPIESIVATSIVGRLNNCSDEKRDYLITSLANSGMSARKIAGVVGKTHPTVRKRIKERNHGKAN